MIRFKCPHCHRPLSVKDHLAGKKANCPACKQPLTIPAPVAAAADLEELAAAALSDEPAARAAAQKPAAMIELECPYCFEAIQFAPELGGKQAPCPQCKRIIKVPLAKDYKPKDWREVQPRGPSGAKREAEPQLEGAWTTAQKTSVSLEALEEADAIPQKKEPVSPLRWVKRGIYGTLALAVVLGGFFALRAYFARSQEESTLNRALAYLDPKKEKVKLVPEWTAELQRAAGEYYLLAGNSEEARKHLGKARAAARQLPASPERDLILIDLALTQLNQGTLPPGERETAGEVWEKTIREVDQTLQEVSEEGRSVAVRLVSSKLIEQGQGALAPTRAQKLSTRAVQVQEKKEDEGEEPLPPKESVEKATPVRAQEIALWLALENPTNAAEVLPKAESPERSLIERIGYAEGFARLGQWDKAKERMKKPGPVKDRFQACLAVADIASRDQASEARSCIEEAHGLVHKGKFKDTSIPVSLWDRFNLARVAARAGLGDKARQLAEELQLPDPLRGRISLEILRTQLAGKKGQAEQTWDNSAPDNTVARALAVLAVARHKARYGSSSAVLEEVEALEPERVRPFGYLGVVLASQDEKNRR
jgi:hypothetical protein